MKVNLKSLLKDKNVLYVVFFIAVINLVGFLMIQDLNAVFFMLIVGFLTSYFSKNMIIILLTALVATNLFATSRSVYVAEEKANKEGFRGREGLKNRKKRESLSPLSPEKVKSAASALDQEEGTGKKPKLDYAATLESAYDNLDNLLGSDAIRNMSEDTQRLADKQKKLMSNIKNLEPMMMKAGKMLEGLDSSKIGGMLSSLEGGLKQLGGAKLKL